MNDIIRAADLIKGSRTTVFFGGAGVSTESGIPDFRSGSGLYAAQSVYGHPPESLLSHTMLIRKPALFFRYYKENLIYPDAKPNAAHTALAALETHGLLSAVITQNIDGLHQAAGSRNVLELHGTNAVQTCMSCGTGYTLEYVMDALHCREGVIPVCETCRGTVRPRVVLYEEPLDGDVVRASVDAIASADLLIVGGTSLAVWPAAGLLKHFSGDAIILINKTATPLDSAATIIIREAIGEALRCVTDTLR
jgi:NAD-dependent deacetylase